MSYPRYAPGSVKLLIELGDGTVRRPSQLVGSADRNGEDLGTKSCENIGAKGMMLVVQSSTWPDQAGRTRPRLDNILFILTPCQTPCPGGSVVPPSSSRIHLGSGNPVQVVLYIVSDVVAADGIIVIRLLLLWMYERRRFLGPPC